MVAATIRKIQAPNHELAVLLVSGSPELSSRSAPLRELSPLRTVRASFLDPFKDTSGPSLNILIKLMSMVAIVMAGLTVAWSLF